MLSNVAFLTSASNCFPVPTPSEGADTHTNETRVFHQLLVDNNESIVSIGGDRLFPLGGSFGMCTYTNQTPVTAQSNNRLTVASNLAISYKLVAYLGYATIIIEYRLYDAEFSELDAIIVYSVSILFGIKTNITTITPSKTFEYTSQENQVYYIGVSMRVELSGFASIGGLDDGSPAVLVLNSVMVIS